MKLSVVVSVVVLCALAPVSARAGGCTPRITGGWLRMPATTMPMLAGYGRIENPCKRPVVITSATSTGFADVSLHRTSLVGGVSRMRSVPALTVRPGSVVELKAGGLHLMLMQPLKTPRPGDRVPVSLKLADGRSLTAMFDVRAAPPPK